jgi:predicted transcriptional regulator
MKISEIYNTNVSTIQENSTIEEAMKELKNKDFNGLLVLNSTGRITGVLSMQDIAAAIVPKQMVDNLSLAHGMMQNGFFQEQCRAIKDRPVKEFMRTEYLPVEPNSSVMEVAAEFLHGDLYITPVMDNNKIIGIVTRSEIKQALIKGMEL